MVIDVEDDLRQDALNESGHNSPLYGGPLPSPTRTPPKEATLDNQIATA